MPSIVVPIDGCTEYIALDNNLIPNLPIGLADTLVLNLRYSSISASGNLYLSPSNIQSAILYYKSVDTIDGLQSAIEILHSNKIDVVCLPATYPESSSISLKASLEQPSHLKSQNTLLSFLSRNPPSAYNLSLYSRCYNLVAKPKSKNYVNRKSEDLLDHSELSKILSYDPKSGKLTWKESIDNAVHPGDEASYTNDAGQRLIKINNHTYRASRIAWFLQNRSWPTGRLSHKDGDQDNLRISNLSDSN